VPPQKSIFCDSDFGSTIALDLQQTFVRSQKQITTRSFLGICSAFV